MDPQGLGWQDSGFIKSTTIHYYTQNMKDLDHVASEKKIVLCFPSVRLWELYVAMEIRVVI